MRKEFRAAALIIWGGTLILTGLLTGNPEPIAKYGARGTVALAFGLGFGIALVAIGGWSLFTSYRRRTF